MQHKSKSAARLEAEREGFHSIEEIKKLNEEKGFHFFDRATLRFFGSRVSDTVYAGRYFVTSEDDFTGKVRRWTVREALPDGRIQTVGKFQRYGSRAAAHRAADKLSEHPAMPRCKHGNIVYRDKALRCQFCAQEQQS